MLTTVIIATHNRHEALWDLLECLNNQDDRPTEVVVVDSEQGDDSRPVVQRASEAGLPVTHILAPNILATKRNYGVRASTGELLVILDDDLLVAPNFLTSHIEAHKGAETRVASGPITFPRDWVTASNYYRFKQGRHSGKRALTANVPPHHFVAMNHSIRRKSYLDMGGYDDDYQMYGGEDLDFGHRAVRTGLDLVVAEGADAIHNEVKMTWTTYFNKVHKAAYFGLPLVMTKNPEAATIPTVQAVGGSRALSLKLRLLQISLSVVSARRSLMILASIFERTDGTPIAFMPRAYMMATLMANRIGLEEHRHGTPYVALS